MGGDIEVSAVHINFWLTSEWIFDKYKKILYNLINPYIPKHSVFASMMLARLLSKIWKLFAWELSLWREQIPVLLTHCFNHLHWGIQAKEIQPSAKRDSRTRPAPKSHKGNVRRRNACCRGKSSQINKKAIRLFCLYLNAIFKVSEYQFYLRHRCQPAQKGIPGTG